MVQKSTIPLEGEAPAPRRGRPPAYDRDRALAQAGDTFWRSGYAATTLDALGDATGMNRPSLYAAFGDKRALYLASFERYATASIERLAETLADGRPLVEQLQAVYGGALEIYLAEKPVPRGCFLIGTAVSESVDDADIRAALFAALKALDDGFEARFRRARADGEIAKDADPKALALVAGGLLNALAVRARAGESKESLRTMAKTGITLMTGA